MTTRGASTLLFVFWLGWWDGFAFGQTPQNSAQCLISEFRTIALGTHNPTERGTLATQWLERNVQGCSTEKLDLLNNNRAAWLGTADSPMAMGLIDRVREIRAQSDPALMKQLFDATPRTFQPTVETIRTEPPQPILQPGASVSLPAISIVNIRQDRNSPRNGNGEDSSDGQGKPTPDIPDFTPPQRAAIRKHFSLSYEIGECPVGLIPFPQEGVCKAQNPIKPWKFDEPIPRHLQNEIREIPNSLLAQLGRPEPGVRFVLLAVDLLKVDADDIIRRAVIDLGQPEIVRRSLPKQAPAPQRTSPPPPDPTPATPTQPAGK